ISGIRGGRPGSVRHFAVIYRCLPGRRRLTARRTRGTGTDGLVTGPWNREAGNQSASAIRPCCGPQLCGQGSENPSLRNERLPRGNEPPPARETTEQQAQKFSLKPVSKSTDQRSRFTRISSPISFVETSLVPSDQISLVRNPLAMVLRTADSIRAAVSSNSNE